MDKPMMIAGGALVAWGVLYAVVAIVKRAEAYEHLWALFLTEAGMGLFVQNMFEDDRARIGVMVFFIISMAWTYVMWWKAWKTRRRAFPGHHTPSPGDRVPGRD